MGQKTFPWFRLTRSRDKHKQSQLPTQQQPQLFADARPPQSAALTPQQLYTHQQLYSHNPQASNPPISPSHLTEETYFQTLPQPFDPTIRESDTSAQSSANSSSIPFTSSTSPHAPVLNAPDIVPIQPSALPPVQRILRSRSSRRARPDASNPKRYDNPPQVPIDQTRDWRYHPHARIAFARAPNPLPRSPVTPDPVHYIVTDPARPAAPVYINAQRAVRPLDEARLSFELDQINPASFTSEVDAPSAHSSVANSAADTGLLDNFVPHRPADRYVQSNLAAAAPGRDLGVSATPPDAHSSDSTTRDAGSTTGGRSRYLKKLGDAQSKFIFRRKRVPRSAASDTAVQPPTQPPDDYFGATQHDERGRSGEIRPGEEVLIRFLRNALGPKAQNLAVRLMNKTPITSSAGFTYVIHQGTEESDIDIIRRDLTSGRLYSSGVRLLGGAWCNLLLGDRFAPGSAPRQRHELTYRRSACSCIICRVKAMELIRAAESDARSQSDYGSDADSTAASADVLSTMSTASRVPVHSAMANFVVRYRLPEKHLLMGIGASSSSRELEIGSVVRLNYRASAKLKFTEDVRELFGHYAYTGPISHEEVYRRVTTIGVHYYLYNKGKKERKVYIQGELIRLPINVGVIKLGTQPMYMPELGATFCLHRKQIMSIYVGELVLEGNAIGSFINTGIQYYIGFGEERGVCPVYPNKTLGKARKLGINELLLHHHMVDDLEVKCL